MLPRNAMSVFIVLFCMLSCGRNAALRYALKSAGDNRAELEKVLRHYKDEPEKLAAAHYLIEGLPAHYSYQGTEIEQYYDIAARILASGLPPEQQRDSLLVISDRCFRDAPLRTISDARIITSGFLIHDIDVSYRQWKNRSWAKQATFQEFCECMLPYKMAELQSLDGWRDTLQSHFTDDLCNMPYDDVEYGTAMRTGDIIKNEEQRKMSRYGLYSRSGLPLLSAYLLPRQTFGDIPDYALIGALALRAAGVPVVIDETPVGARYEAATRWFVVLSDRGTWEPSEWDLSTGIGWGFFPYERGPKVWRRTYSINKERLKYLRKARVIYPFDLCKTDVTGKYFLTTDLTLPISRETRKRLRDKYVYIASAVRDTTHAQQSRSFTGEYSKQLPQTFSSVDPGWCIVDFGQIHRRNAIFRNMGREVLYQAYGYDGERLISITKPFILHKDNHIEYISDDTINSPSLDKWRNNPLL